MSGVDRREFLKKSAVATAAVALTGAASEPSDTLRIGCIGLGWRGKELLTSLDRTPGVRVTMVCDVDTAVMAQSADLATKAARVGDLRRVIESPDVDAVVIATCNHWHCLAGIWAVEAGKDVYVEKPLGHNLWEQEQMVRAARKHNRIVQVGTQQRSDPMQAEIKRFLHEEKPLGDILCVEACRYGVRASVGKRATELVPPKTCDFDLWTGPAQKLPLYREALHYDWHWDWNTGGGEMGNWGVHIMDDIRNTVLLDQGGLPRSVAAGGGRLLWDDAGQTPNVHFARFDSGGVPVVIGLSNLPAAPNERRGINPLGVESGYIVWCEGGHYRGQRGHGEAYDAAGKQVRAFRGDPTNQRHLDNFFDAVRSRDRARLHADVETGHASSAWCLMANLAYRVAGPFDASTARGQDPPPAWGDLLGRLDTQLRAHGSSLAAAGLSAGAPLAYDAASGRFTGDHAAEANKLLRREYRAGFEVQPVA